MTEQEYREYVSGQLEGLEVILKGLIRYTLTPKQRHAFVDTCEQLILEGMAALDRRTASSKSSQGFTDQITHILSELKD